MVDELGTSTVMVVVITPLVVVKVESEVVSLSGIELTTISPDAALAAQPRKYTPYSGSKKFASYECVTQCGRFELLLFFTQRKFAERIRLRIAYQKVVSGSPDHCDDCENSRHAVGTIQS